MAIVEPLDVVVDEQGKHGMVLSNGTLYQCMVCGRWTRIRILLDTVLCVPMEVNDNRTPDELEVR